MNDDDATYSIGELATLAGVSVRTVRYYVAHGLLAGPSGSGQAARYVEGHLARLRLVRRLQAQHQPLAEIRSRLAALTDRQVQDLLRPNLQPPPDSALDYVTRVLAGPSAAQPAPAPQPTRLDSAPGQVAFRFAASPTVPPPADVLSGPGQTAGTAASAAFPEEPTAGPNLARSQWDRIPLTPDIELHVRRPLGRLENRRVERLLDMARRLLREDQP
jgi:DNA-binding transcriptional MerR regulator